MAMFNSHVKLPVDTCSQLQDFATVVDLAVVFLPRLVVLGLPRREVARRAEDKRDELASMWRRGGHELLRWGEMVHSIIQPAKKLGLTDLSIQKMWILQAKCL